jgi:hypothetical protein
MLTARVVTTIGLAVLAVGCCHSVREPSIQVSETAPVSLDCPGPELPEAKVREIGAATVRARNPGLRASANSNARVARDGCNYVYLEVFDPKIVGAFVTVVIAPDGRVLDVIPGL